ncbi:MAG: Stenotrophomonas phage Pokken [Pseudomonadota bacterium]
MTNFERTALWLSACGKTPGVENTSVQIGCHLEELIEFLRCLRLDSDGGQLIIDRTVVDIEWLAGKLKRRAYTAHIPNHLRAEALDALCDAEVTGNGVAYLAGMDKLSADLLVLAANDAKLVDGRPVLLEGGKIGKPEGWKAPDLSSLV